MEHGLWKNPQVANWGEFLGVWVPKDNLHFTGVWKIPQVVNLEVLTMGSKA